MVVAKKSKLTKTDFVAVVAERTGMSKAETKRVVDAILEVITQQLAAGNKITLTGFGAFEVRKTKERYGVHPRTQAKIHIPAASRPVFSAGAELKRAIKGS